MITNLIIIATIIFIIIVVWRTALIQQVLCAISFPTVWYTLRVCACNSVHMFQYVPVDEAKEEET